MRQVAKMDIWKAYAELRGDGETGLDRWTMNGDKDAGEG